MDTVQNYSASDTHVNIENGLPTPTTPASNSGNSRAQAGLSSFISVTGGNPTLLSCEVNPAILRTQDNNLVFFYDLCGYSVLLNDSVSAELLAAVPSDQTYLTGISLTLLNGSEVINEVPDGVTAKLKISDPASLGKTMTALYWEVTGDNGAGAWVELPVVVSDGYAVLNLQNSGSYILTVE